MSNQQTPKLTWKHVKAYAELLGATVRRTPAGDIAVRPIAGGEDCYFASDLVDALGTMRVMLGSHPKRPNAEQELPPEYRVGSGPYRIY